MKEMVLALPCMTCWAKKESRPLVGSSQKRMGGLDNYGMETRLDVKHKKVRSHNLRGEG